MKMANKSQVHELRGSHSVLQLADVCIAMNKLKEDPHGNFRELFVLKNRFTGQCGPAGLLEYNPEKEVYLNVQFKAFSV